MRKPIIASMFLAGALAFSSPAVSFADVAKEDSSSSTSKVISLQQDGSSIALAKKASKNGLVKKGSSYYFYKNGKMVKRTWKTVKGAKYYFQKNGKAAVGSCKIGGKYYVFKTNGKLAKGSKTRVVTIKKVKYQVTKKGVAKSGWNSKKTNYFLKTGAVFKNGTKKIGSSTYAFDPNGMLIKGDGVKKINSFDYKFLCANSSGIYDAARTKLLNSYATYEKDCTDLIALLGSPLSVRVDKGCNSINNEPADDAIYTYKNFKLHTFKLANGRNYFMYLE